jgi:hypothetical protein
VILNQLTGLIQVGTNELRRTGPEELFDDIQTTGRAVRRCWAWVSLRAFQVDEYVQPV